MKNLNIEFEEREFKRVLKVKEITHLSWKNFIIALLERSEWENQHG